MKSYFKRFNLVDSLVLEVDMNSKDFIQKLNGIVDYDKGFLKDEFYKSRKLYLGEVNGGNFILRKKRSFMKFNPQSSRAIGSITDMKDKTKVNIEILGYDEMSSVSVITGPIFFLILSLVIIFTKAYPLFIIVLPIAILMIRLPYFLMKRGIKKFKLELEKSLKFE